MAYNIEDEIHCLNETHKCTFRLVNGSVLTIIGIIGLLLSLSVMYSLIWRIKLPLSQNTFILSVSCSDTLIAIVAIMRGLGIISKDYIGGPKEQDGTDFNVWCVMFTILANSTWNAVVLVLIPLTMDRFIAVVFTMKYKSIVNKWTSKLMVVCSWLPVIGLFLYDTISIIAKKMTLKYMHEYHRCVIHQYRGYVKIVFIIIPYFSIFVMYGFIVFCVLKFKQQTPRFFIMATAIISTGFLAYFPELLLVLVDVSLSYEEAQVLTVTLYYVNCICNPCIYFWSNTSAQNCFKNSIIGRRLSGWKSSQTGSEKATSSTNIILNKNAVSTGQAESTGKMDSNI